MNYKILQVLAILMSKTSFDRDGLNRFKPGGLNQGGQNLPTLDWLLISIIWLWRLWKYHNLAKIKFGDITVNRLIIGDYLFGEIGEFF